MTSGPNGPPRLARALLELLLPHDEAGSVTGDLDEEFVRYACPQRGPRAASRWYWGQVLRSLPSLVVRRVSAGSVATGLESLREDARFALRMLRRRPGFAASAILTLTLGLGVNAAVFSVVDAVLITPLPWQNADRLVRPMPDELFYVDGPESALLAERMNSFEEHVPWGRSLFLFTTDSDAEEVRGARVGWNHFDVLGTEPRLGRAFVRSDAEAPDVVILSHGLWVRRFGADPDIVGRTTLISERSMTIVGVMGPEHVPIEFDWEVWRPLPLDPAASAGAALGGTALLGRGVSLAQAEEEMQRVLPGIWEESGAEISPAEREAVTLEPLTTWRLGDHAMSLIVLGVAVALLLLLACVNVAGLLVAQENSREREFAVRSALGGSTFRVVRQRAAEVGLLFAAGGVAALGAAAVSLEVLRSALPADLPRVSAVAVSPRVIVYAGTLCFVTALATGVVPHLRTRGRSKTGVVGSGRGHGAARHRARFHAMLVAVEMAFAVVLVVGAGLMLRTLASLRSVDPGFAAAHVVTVRPSPPASRYPDEAALTDFYDRVAVEMSAVPGVDAVGGIMFLPMTPGGWWTSYVSGEWPEGAEPGRTAARLVYGDYFEAMGIEVVSGRPILGSDAVEEAEPVVVVNERLARENWPDGEAVGRTLVLSGESRRIVGVVADVRQSELRSEGHPEVYVPFAVRPWRRMHMVARVSGEPDAMLDAVAAAVRSVDPRVALLGPHLVDDVVMGTMSETRLVAVLLTLFGLIGLGLGAVGVYGVTAQAVALRQREIGVRLALGAAPDRVMATTIGRGMIPVVLGLLAGLVVCVGGSRLLEGLLYGVEALDARTFLAAPLALSMVAVLALTLPALRASRVDPVSTLRQE